jgi:hypothetical protein
MRCPVCERPAEDGQRFCTGCGTPLRDVGDSATSVVAAQTAVESEWADPVWAPTGSVPATPTDRTATEQLPATEAIDATEPTGPDDTPPAVDPPVLTPYDYGGVDDGATATAPTGSTTTMLPGPYVVDPYADPYAAHDRAGRFRFTAVLVLGVATGLVALVALFTDVLSIQSDRLLAPDPDAPAGFGTGVWLLDDLADNLSVAGMLAAVAMVAGGVASGFGWKWGGGLAGGGGLAFGGVAAIAIGLAQMPIDAAHEYARIPADPPFTLTITRDLGYHLLIVAAALGLVLFFTSFNDASDHRPGLNPWVAALGGLSVVITATGPLLPEGLALFSDNWYIVEAPGEPPAMLLVGRIIQLVGLLVAGLIGFLSVRRYGVGLAVGGSLPVIWMAASTLFDLTDHPVGPGFRNPGSPEIDLHGVTVIGVAALASMLLLAVIAAYDQTVRERP